MQEEENLCTGMVKTKHLKVGDVQEYDQNTRVSLKRGMILGKVATR